MTMGVGHMWISLKGSGGRRLSSKISPGIGSIFSFWWVDYAAFISKCT
jgi:hypothetical protein